MADMDPETFRALGHRLVDWVADYRAGLDERPVQARTTPGEVRALLPEALPEQPAEDLGEDLVRLLDDVVAPHTLQWQHPGFFGYFPANASLYSLLGDLASGAIGAQGMLWSTGQAGTELEQVLLDGLARALGLPETFTFAGGGGGALQDSASSGALVALLAALHRRTPGWRGTGVTGSERVYVTADTHSSLARAVRVAGLGERALRTVPFAAGTRRMSAAALGALLAEDVAAGGVPVLVCATVGTTSTGAVDPVAEVVAATRPYGAWVHVDAAWAGVAALCPEHRALLDGAAEADSLSTNAHKWLLTAFDASLLWVRDGRALPEALSITPEYLRNAASDSGAVVDYRDWQVPLGRRMRALKLWAVLQGRGLDGLRDGIRAHVASAAWLADQVRGSDRFRLAAEPSLSLVCLQVAGPDGPDDAASRRVLEEVNAGGRSFLTHTVVDGHYTLRVAVGGVSTEHAHVVRLWEDLQACAAEPA